MLKRGGQHSEQWQQESAAAVAKRLVVAAQALVLVWALLQSPEPEAAQLRRALIHLSGRLMRRGVEATAPALFAGLWNLLAILAALERYSLDDLQQMAQLIDQMLGGASRLRVFKELV